MTRRLAAASLALILMMSLGATVVASQKPSFSGTWIVQPPNKGAGREQVVKQDEKTLSVTNAGRTVTYQLGGPEVRQTMAMRGGEIVILNKAAWEGNTIVLTITTSYPNNMRTIEKEIWSIDAQGQLVVELSETAEGQPPRSMKIIHKKKS